MQRLPARELTASSLFVYPLAVFIAGNLLFDHIGKPFSDHALQATGSIAKGGNPNEVITDGLVWAATAHAYLIISLVMMLYLARWAWLRMRAAGTKINLYVAAALASLGIGYLAYADHNARPVRAIFRFTYQSVAGSELTGKSQIQDFLNYTLTTINLISVIAPALLIALAPLLVREPIRGWTERELIMRVKETQVLGLMTSAFMVAGVLHMYAWMSWAPEILNKKGLETVVGGVTFFWGSVFTTMLAAFYLPVLFILQKQSEAVMDAQQIPLIERDQWLQQRGLSLRIINQLPQAIGILAPLIATPAGQLLANLGKLAPK